MSEWVKVAQLCPTLCDPMQSPWPEYSPDQNTGVGSLSLLQGIFWTQGSNPGLTHRRQILYQLSFQGSPRRLEWVAYPFSRGSSRLRNWTRVFCIAGGFFTNWTIYRGSSLNEYVISVNFPKRAESPSKCCLRFPEKTNNHVSPKFTLLITLGTQWKSLFIFYPNYIHCFSRSKLNSTSPLSF